MLEALLAATATSGLVVLARGQRRQVISIQDDQRAWAKVDESVEDLPCPWCYSPTAATDDRCPNCHRRFG